MVRGAGWEDLQLKGKTMGIWDLFRRNKPLCEILPEQIWFDDDSTNQGVLEIIRERLSANEHLLLTSRFEQRLQELAALLQEADLPAEPLQQEMRPQDFEGELQRGGAPRLYLAPASLLVGDPQPRASEDWEPPWSLTVLVREHHPLRAADERIERFVGGLPNARLQYLSSLDDALLQTFIDPQVREILRKMGMDRGESVSSGMVGKRLRSAQKRLNKAHGARALQDAASSQAWLKANGY